MVATLPARIPVINLQDYRSGGQPDRRAFVDTFGKGMEAFGFVAIEGHGIDAQLIRDVYDLFEQFFHLDSATKLAYELPTGGQRGYTAFGKEHAKDSKAPDLKEFWHVGQELPTDHALYSAYEPNIWPKELPAFKAKTLSLFRALEDAAEVMLRALADFYGLPNETFASLVKDGNSILRAIHYPPLGPDAPAGAVRAAAHEDINLLTILCEATSGGLELLTHDGEWVSVASLSGQLIVDSGDMLSRMTNLKVPSTTHRVVNPPNDANVARYSLPFFVHPFPDADLTVLDRFTSADNPAKFPPITADAFLTQRLREIGLIK